MMLLDLLLPSRQSRILLASKVLGCFFLMLGVAVGLFFLFQILVPIFGYLESGFVISAVLIALAIAFFFLAQNKQTTPQEEAIQKALNIFKDFDLESLLKNKPFAITLLSFIAGIILSQLKKSKIFQR